MRNPKKRRKGRWVRSPPPVHPGYGAVDAALERCQLLRGHLVHPHERKWRGKNGAEADAVPHREYYLFPVDFASCQTIQFLLRPVLLEEAGTQNDNTEA